MPVLWQHLYELEEIDCSLGKTHGAAQHAYPYACGPEAAQRGQHH